jgi:hypothetical protein
MILAELCFLLGRSKKAAKIVLRITLEQAPAR